MARLQAREPSERPTRPIGMTTGLRRWLVPVAAALGVLLVIGVLLWQRGPDETRDAGAAGYTPPGADGSGVPGSPGSGVPRSPGTPGDDLTPVPPPDVPPRPDTQVIDSYYAYDDTRIALNYTTGVPECYGKVGEPVVEETADAVTVTLPKLPPKQRSDIACIDIALSKSVDVVLDAPLGDRVVRDGSRDGAEVPPGTANGAPGQAS